eukprot:3453244-Pyramimonas_sp.AAC.1
MGQELLVTNSAGGPGSGQWLQVPQKPADKLTDQQFVTSVRLRMHLPIFIQAGACGYVSRQQGRSCGAH